MVYGLAFNKDDGCELYNVKFFDKNKMQFEHERDYKQLMYGARNLHEGEVLSSNTQGWFTKDCPFAHPMCANVVEPLIDYVMELKPLTM